MRTSQLIHTLLLLTNAACTPGALTYPEAGTSDAVLADTAGSDAASVAWPVPAGWRSEVIPFPLSFAPTLAHQGREELRFPPGVFDVGSSNYWAYAFAWRLDDAGNLDAGELGAELTIYFRGLVTAIDAGHRLPPVEDIEVRADAAVPPAGGYLVTAHLLDAFNLDRPVDLTGTARRLACGRGALWLFVLSPSEGTTIRTELDQLAATAGC